MYALSEPDILSKLFSPTKLTRHQCYPLINHLYPPILLTSNIQYIKKYYDYAQNEPLRGLYIEGVWCATPLSSSIRVRKIAGVEKSEPINMIQHTSFTSGWMPKGWSDFWPYEHILYIRKPTAMMGCLPLDILRRPNRWDMIKYMLCLWVCAAFMLAKGCFRRQIDIHILFAQSLVFGGLTACECCEMWSNEKRDVKWNRYLYGWPICGSSIGNIKGLAE